MEQRTTLITAKDIEEPKAFHKSVLGLDVATDAGADEELTGRMPCS